MNIFESGLLGIGPALIAKSPELSKYISLNPKKVEEDELKKKQLSEGRAAGTQAVAGEGMKRGGSVSSASRRADGIATKGKTRGKLC